tara:strand:- start:20 stop:472 length:453 start_codon:yes stop_codon:yes gene_type:complete
MNKAFVKEPEQADPRCPAPQGCEGIGTPVTRKTLLAQAPEDAAQDFSDSCFYCPNPSCQVAYFDIWGKCISRDIVRTLAYPKSPTAPICSCFGLTAQEVREDAEAGHRERVRELIAKAEGGEASCETAAPSGKSCAMEIRRIFLKYFPRQ